MRFDVIDPKTGTYPDVEKIALTEEWAKNLIYCDIDSFAITEDGHLTLTDDCNNIAYCPEGRFKVVAQTSKWIEVKETIQELHDVHKDNPDVELVTRFLHNLMNNLEAEQ